MSFEKAKKYLQEKGYEVIGLYFDAMGKGREDAGAVRAEIPVQQYSLRQRHLE